MDPHAYPDPQTKALNLATQVTTPAMPIEQLASAVGTVNGDPFGYIRLAMSDPLCAPLAAPVMPDVILQIDGLANPANAPLTDQTVAQLNGGSLYVADAKIEPDPNFNNVYLITIDHYPPNFHPPPNQRNWAIIIKNNEPATRDFTWVVSATQANTIQPWIDVMPGTLSYDVLVNGSVGNFVQVRNKGTGPLTVSGLSPALPASLQVGPLPSVNPGLAQSLTITFTGDAVPPMPDGIISATETVSSGSPDDLLATISPGHNHQLAISATTQRLEVMMLLDDSGSMTWDRNGNFPPQGGLTSRWAELVLAVNQFLGLLAFFGFDKNQAPGKQSRGRYGIACFPSTRPGDFSSFDIVPPTDITADMGDAEKAVAKTTPSDSTPMGDGIDRVFAPATSYFNTDALSIAADRRWLLLMSDGAHNAGTHNPTEYILPPDGTATAGTSLSDKNIELFALGYGITGKSNVDPVLLASLANGSYKKGMIRRADDENLTYLQVAQAFQDAIKAGITPTSSPGDPFGVFRQGQGQARHHAIITRYDGKTAFLLNWETSDPHRLRLELVTPNCELITPESAGQGNLADVIFRGGDRFQMYLIGRDFVQNTADPTSPRFGPWTLIITGLSEDPDPELIRERPRFVEVENYSYNIMLESDLRMELSLDKGAYYAGDPIALSAKLMAEGRPVSRAIVSVSTSAPGRAFANWLAGLDIPADALARARDFLAGKDSTPVLIKTVAAGFAGFSFDPAKQQGVLPMTELGGMGLYQTTFTNTSTPELYTFYVTAIGVTADGVNFQREGSLSTHVLVRPDPAFTHLDVQFGEPGSAQAVVVPRDRFGNVLLVDPTTFPSFALQVTDGSFAGPLVSNLDGTYSRGLKFDPGVTPIVGVTFGGKTIQQTTLPPVSKLRWVDKVIKFVLGAEAAPGANQHKDPRAALGDVFRRPVETFVSLGAGGVLSLALDDLVIVAAADNDVTVYVHPDTDPRPYRVEVFVPRPDILEEALRPRPSGWVTLGDSAGGTQSFGLHKANVEIAVAIRVTDRSRRTRGKDFKPLSTPGVSIRGVGVLRVSDHIPWGLLWLRRFCEKPED